MVIVQFHGRLVRQYRTCVVNSLGLGITCHITVLCVQGIPILSFLIFMSSLYSHLKNFYINLSPLIFKGARNEFIIHDSRLLGNTNFTKKAAIYTDVVCSTIQPRALL